MDKQIELLLKIVKKLEENQQLLEQQNKCVRELHNVLAEETMKHLYRYEYDQQVINDRLKVLDAAKPTTFDEYMESSMKAAHQRRLQDSKKTVTFKILLDSLFKTFKTKTDHTYHLNVKSTKSNFMSGQPPTVNAYFEGDFVCGSNDEVFVTLDLKINKLNEPVETTFYFDLTVRDADGCEVDTLFQEKVKTRVNKPKPQTLPSFMSDARRKYGTYHAIPRDIVDDISEATLSDKAITLCHWLQHMPTVTGKLARGDRDFLLPYSFVTEPSTMIYDMVKDSHDKCI